MHPILHTHKRNTTQTGAEQIYALMSKYCDHLPVLGRYQRYHKYHQGKVQMDAPLSLDLSRLY